MDNKKNHYWIIPVTLLLVVLLAVSALFLLLGKDNGTFQKNSYLNGVEVSEMTPTEAKDYYNNQVSDKEFVFISASGNISVLGSSFGYLEFLSSELDGLVSAQNRITRAFSSWKKTEHSINTDSDYDSQRLSDVAANLAKEFNKNATPSINAYVEKNDTDFVVVDAVQGSEVCPIKLADHLNATITTTSADIDLNNPDLALEPEITADGLKKTVVADLEKAADLDIAYDFKYTKETVPKKLIFEALEIDPKTSEIIVNSEKLVPFFSGLAKQYDTLGKNRDFTTSDGDMITVGGGIYGWQLNIYSSADNLGEHILALDEGTFDPVYTTMGYARIEGNEDIDNTYVEIDLTKQHLWFYKNGELIVSTDVVTGLPGTPRETPTGVFSLWSKETKRYLTGEDYKLWVEFWLPINWTGVGIHDAPWQETFGGDRYLTYGSHGCVNTPYDHVSTIYKNIEENTPVIVYKS